MNRYAKVLVATLTLLFAFAAGFWTGSHSATASATSAAEAKIVAHVERQNEVAANKNTDASIQNETVPSPPRPPRMHARARVAALEAALLDFLSDHENYEAYRLHYQSDVRKEYASILDHLGVTGQQRAAVVRIIADQKLHFFEGLLIASAPGDAAQVNALSLSVASGASAEMVELELLELLTPAQAAAIIDFGFHAKEWKSADQFARRATELGAQLTPEELVGLVTYMHENKARLSSDRVKNYALQALGPDKAEALNTHISELEALRRMDQLNERMKQIR